ncbi:MAG: hypothetical protein IT518_27705 [Burkholderiales bacterium]|nr:hypothetical protein [Burkholderiales bacterium]
MYDKPNRRYAVAAALVAVALTAIAVAWPTQEKGAVVGVRTGEYQDGVPVYRLPTVTVSVKRSEALAKIAREEAIASNAGRQ